MVELSVEDWVEIDILPAESWLLGILHLLPVFQSYVNGFFFSQALFYKISNFGRHFLLSQPFVELIEIHNVPFDCALGLSRWHSNKKLKEHTSQSKYVTFISVLTIYSLLWWCIVIYRETDKTYNKFIFLLFWDMPGWGTRFGCWWDLVAMYGKMESRLRTTQYNRKKIYLRLLAIYISIQKLYQYQTPWFYLIVKTYLKQTLQITNIIMPDYFLAQKIIDSHW